MKEIIISKTILSSFNLRVAVRNRSLHNHNNLSCNNNNYKSTCCARQPLLTPRRHINLRYFATLSLSSLPVSSSTTSITRIHLPALGQNGTLHLSQTKEEVDDQRRRSTRGIVESAIRHVRIIPSQEREDTIIDFVPAAFDCGLARNDSDDDKTHGSMVYYTLDRDLGGVTSETKVFSSLQSQSTQLKDSSTTTTTATTTTCSNLLLHHSGLAIKLTQHWNGRPTSLGRVGPFVTATIVDQVSISKQEGNDSNNVTIISSPPSPYPPWMDIIIRIPQKFNISCLVSNGNFEVDDKLEGDLHLCTSSGGNIVLHGKVRGHEIALESFQTRRRGERSSDHDDDVCTSAQRTNTSRIEVGEGIIHVRKSLEAGNVRIRTDSPYGRIRARMLKVGSGLTMDVVSSSHTSLPSSCLPPRPLHASSSVASTNKEDTSSLISFVKLDDDDEGAIIDVGSVYVVSSGDNNEATLNVNINSTSEIGNDHSLNGLVRVKTSHGHLVVHAKDGRRQPLTKQKVRTPLIDLGGVNGSCDVLLEVPCISSGNVDDHKYHDGKSKTNNESSHHHYLHQHQPDLRVHFDSMSPVSISTITSRRKRGVREYRSKNNRLINSITVDRKLETDVRLLAMTEVNDTNTCVDAHALTQSDDIGGIHDIVNDIADKCSSSVENSELHDEFQQCKSIFIESNAFVNEVTSCLSQNGIYYVHGTMTNRSGEPDSRLDARSSSHHRYECGSGGKINIEGAASQALHGFQGKPRQETDSVSTDTLKPLLAVATDGTIILETLSWFGSIARRYGLEENVGGAPVIGSVGRQASRSPRLEKP